MPRPPRFFEPEVPLHVIQRGNNRSRIFEREADQLFCLETLLEASKRTSCAIHAYVLMTNHLHLLVTPPSVRGASRMMQILGTKYVRYFNKRRGRTGTLFEGRFRATLIDSERYYLTCSRYIELNPVRAGMVSDASQHRWSSFCSNALGATDPLVTPHWLLRGLGTRPADARRAYRDLFSTEQDPIALDAIRTATNTGVRISEVNDVVQRLAGRG